MINEIVSFLVCHKSILWIKEEDDTYKVCALLRHIQIKRRNWICRYILPFLFIY